MEKLSHLLRMNWLKVPDVLYDILLFGGWIGLIVPAALLIRGIIRKQSGKASAVQLAVLAVSLLAIVLTMTGKIAAMTMFGG
ncbi:MAG: hypothetical protein PUC47_11900 [Oscillospiraceae bacterium]|nr:hypothetical protein [Oscillospiraceae bacterium]